MSASNHLRNEDSGLLSRNSFRQTRDDTWALVVFQLQDQKSGKTGQSDTVADIRTMHQSATTSPCTDPLVETMSWTMILTASVTVISGSSLPYITHALEAIWNLVFER